MPALQPATRHLCRCGVSIKITAFACYNCRRNERRREARGTARRIKQARKEGVSPFALLYRDAKNDPARKARFAAERKRIDEAVKRAESDGLAKISVGRGRPSTWDEQTYEGVGVWRGQGKRVLYGIRTA